jgi:hypothetical protein
MILTELLILQLLCHCQSTIFSCILLVYITGSFVSVITACSTVILENFVVP